MRLSIPVLIASKQSALSKRKYVSMYSCTDEYGPLVRTAERLTESSKGPVNSNSFDDGTNGSSFQSMSDTSSAVVLAVCLNVLYRNHSIVSVFSDTNGFINLTTTPAFCGSV